MKVTVAVIDGMGGGIGVQLVEKVRAFSGESGGPVEIIALGANGAAAERMIKAGADKGASGENAIRVTARNADFILGPIGIVIADSMMGEITQGMAEAVLSSKAERILLPLPQEHFIIAGLESRPLAKVIDMAADVLKERIRARFGEEAGRGGKPYG